MGIKFNKTEKGKCPSALPLPSSWLPSVKAYLHAAQCHAQRRVTGIKSGRKLTTALGEEAAHRKETARDRDAASSRPLAVLSSDLTWT